MTQRYRHNRILIEFDLLAQRFGEITYDKGFEWIILRRYPLPRDFRPRATNLLLWIPSLYPLIPPCSFAISAKLSKGRTSVDSLNNLNPYSWRGWLYFEIPLNSWRPTYNISSGDNLLTLMNQISEFLDNL